MKAEGGKQGKELRGHRGGLGCPPAPEPRPCTRFQVDDRTRERRSQQDPSPPVGKGITWLRRGGGRAKPHPSRGRRAHHLCQEVTVRPERPPAQQRPRQTNPSEHPPHPPTTNPRNPACDVTRRANTYHQSQGDLARFTLPARTSSSPLNIFYIDLHGHMHYQV